MHLISRRTVALAVGTVLSLLATLLPQAVVASDTSHLQLSGMITSITVNPNLLLTLNVDKAAAIPGDTLTYSGQVTHTGITACVFGSFNAKNNGTSSGTITDFFDEIDFWDQNQLKWVPLVGVAYTQTAFVPVVTPRISTGITLTVTSVPASGVNYPGPTSGNPIIGTTIAAGATASWTGSACLTLTAAQLNALFNSPSLREEEHMEDTPGDPLGEEWTCDQSSVNPLRAGLLNAKNVVITVTPPTGPAVQITSNQVPALSSLPPGGSASYSTTYQVPVVPARGSSETELAYTQRLSSADGFALTGKASVTATGPTGPVSASAPAVATTQHIPIMLIIKTGPATVNAGDTETNPLSLQNVGGATASSLVITDAVPGGAGTVSSVPASMGPGVTGSATATYPVPIGQSEGDLTDTATISWKDPNGNPYGSFTSSFTTHVHNILFSAKLTLAPASAGPNAPGNTQTLTATLLDRNGNPIAGQTVSFMVTGANPATGSGTTDTSGNAVFTYTGNKSGNDVAQATVSAPGITLTSNTSSISWGKPLQPVVLDQVQGNFFQNPNNSCTFDATPASTPAFGQTFPDILFNPASTVVPHNISSVNNTTRPFTDLTVDINGNYNGQLVAQGNGQQAGVGSLTNFFASFTGNFVVSQAGDVTFTILHDDGYLLGVGNGATRVNGDFEGNPPANTPFSGYPVVAAWNLNAASSTTGTATVHFPAAGTYPYELDYTKCSATGPLFLVLETAQFIAQTDPLSIYVGYADGLRPAGSVFPFPWQGSPGVTFVGGCTFDAGALRFDNSGTTDITLDKVTVDLGSPPGAPHFDIWPANLVVPAHGILILTQTGCYNFDTSDYSGAPCGGNNGVQPLVNVGRGGVTTTYTDTHQILNTRGFDLACQGNESTPWQRIAGQANTINTPVPPGVSLDIMPFNVPNALIGQNQTLTVSAMDAAGNPIGNLPVTLKVFGPNAQTLTGTTGGNGLAAFGYVGGAKGTDSIQASAFSGGLRSISNLGSVTWSVPLGGGPNPGPNPDPNAPPPPTITAPSPADGTVITKPVAVDATITPPTGHTITSWRVFYQEAGSSTQVVIKSGTGAPPSPLGATFDPTVLVNDIYVLTIEATADNGAVQDLSSGIAVYGGLKIGRYTTSFTDLAVPVNGFQMQLQRNYDSTDKSIGDFGIGWRISLTNFRTSSNRVLGAGGWTQYNKSCTLGLCFTAFKNSAPRYVTVVYPTGRSEVFDFTPTGGTNIFWSCTPTFTARASMGATSSLVPLDDTGCSYTGDGNLYGSNGLYNPHQFKLTTLAGQVLVLDTRTGLVSMTDRNGNKMSIDAAGVHASNGQSLTFTRDASGRVITVTGPVGETLHYTYSTAGDLASSVDPNGNTTTYGYDSNHNLVSGSVNGTAFKLPSQQYDASGRLVAVTDAAGNRIPITNSITGQTITATDALGTLTTVTHMDDLGDVTAIDQISGGQTLTVSFTYDAVGHRTSRTDSLGHTSSVAYDAQGNPTAYTDENGHTTRFTYDSFGMLTSVIGPDGSALQSTTYDGSGRPTRVQGSDGSIRTFTYDSAGRAASMADAVGRTFNFSYDANGHLASMTDPSGGSTLTNNDASGHLLSVTDPAGNKVALTYDANGNVLSLKDAQGRTQSNTYDALGHTLTSTDAAGKTSTYTYDAAGNLTSVVDRSGNTTSFTYDLDGNLIRAAYPGGSVTSFNYDGLGRLTRMGDAVSSIATTYDAASRVIAQAETLPVVGTITNSYTYDAGGNRTTFTSADGTTRYAYDSRDRLTSITDPSGGVFAITYDSAGHLASLARPNGVTDAFSYDLSGKLLSRTATRSGTTVALSSQTFNSAGEVASRTDLNGTTSYTHDSTGQLTGVTAPGGATSSYVYDSAGNRVSDPVSTSMTYDPANRLLSDSNFTYTYDQEGNRVARTNRATGAVTRYTYDAHGKLSSVQNPDGTTTGFTYDVLGRRVQVTGSGQTTTYSYDGANIHLEYSGASQVASYTGPMTTDHPLEMRRGGQPYYYLSDVAGNITGLSDVSGSSAATYSYDAFGVPTGSTGTVANPFTYAGREFDAKSGLYYNRARYYEPSTGRFLSEDPVPSVNAYAYAHNDPVDFNDPTGATFVEYLANTFRATIQDRIFGCLMAVFAVAVEYILGWVFKGKIDVGMLALNSAVGCAFGALLPGVKPNSALSAVGWLVFIIPILLAVIAAILDVINQIGCHNQTGKPIDPAHVLIVFLLTFIIAHYFGGIWGVASGALSGKAVAGASTVLGLLSGTSAGLGDQLPGGACG